MTSRLALGFRIRELSMDSDKSRWTRAVLRVGDGRGFVVAGQRERVVVTAGHWLPRLPPSMTFSFTEERTYAKLLGHLGGKKLVWAECAFVNPIADLAVLASPDCQALWEEAEAYEAFIDGFEPLPIGDLPLARSPIVLHSGDALLGPPEWEGAVWLFALTGQWFRCEATAGRHMIGIPHPKKAIARGLSGSPIVSDDGCAVGVIVTGATGAQPFLARQFPAWLLEELGLDVCRAPDGAAGNKQAGPGSLK